MNGVGAFAAAGADAMIARIDRRRPPPRRRGTCLLLIREYEDPEAIQLYSSIQLLL